MCCKSCGAEISENDKFCRECGTPVPSKEEKSDSNVDEYGMTKLNAKFFKKAVIVLLCIAIIAVAVAVYRNNRWKGNIDVMYIGYTSSDSRYHEWELKNESGKTLNGVKIVYKVDNWQEFTFEHEVGTLHVGETKTVRLYWNTVKAEAEKRNKTLMLANVDILRIVYD